MDTLIESLGDVGESVWSQTVGLTLRPSGVPERSASPMIQGQVHVTGAWQGTLVLQCSTVAARRATESMFNMQGTDVSQDDVSDAVGELANILGGTIKSIVSETGCYLSLPVVVEGADFAVRAPNTRVVARQAFDEGGEPVIVTVLEALPRAQA